jgi:ABC-type nitrate/sulfonate/bicarbonate transport system substrate-binding protein
MELTDRDIREMKDIKDFLRTNGVIRKDFQIEDLFDKSFLEKARIP